MSLFDEITSAYTHNGDDRLLASLGLKTTGYKHGEYTELGTVVVREADTENRYEALTGPCPETTVKVEVYCLPAQFWRFTITMPRDETVDDERAEHGFRAVYEPVKVFEVRTGSGSFGTYWPAIKLLAEDMLVIKRLDTDSDES